MMRFLRCYRLDLGIWCVLPILGIVLAAADASAEACHSSCETSVSYCCGDTCCVTIDPFYQTDCAPLPGRGTGGSQQLSTCCPSGQSVCVNFHPQTPFPVYDCFDAGYSKCAWACGVLDVLPIDAGDPCDGGSPIPYDPPGGACTEFGDPIAMQNGASRFTVSDVRIPGSLGGIDFSRTFDDSAMRNAGGAWLDDAPLAATPMPFGRSSYNSQVPDWWHNFLAVVVDHEHVWSVRDQGGFLHRFSPCATAPCFGRSIDTNAGTPTSLERTTTGFILWRGDGERLVFDAAYVQPGSPGTKKHFLTSILNMNGATKLALTYQAPAGLTCFQGATGTSSGVPYLHEVASPEARIRFTYSALTPSNSGQAQCVIRAIELVNLVDAGVHSTLATYTYQDDGTAERPGMIAAAAALSNETYTFDGGSVIRSVGTFAVSNHTVATSGGNYRKVIFDESVGERLSVSYGTGTCASGSDCCGEMPRSATVSSHSAQRGDGTPGDAGLQMSYLTLMNYSAAQGQQYRPRLYETTTSCGDDAWCSAGTTRSEWTCSQPDGGLGYEKATKNKRDNWTAFEWAHVDGGLPRPRLEKRATFFGATDMNGSNALETENYGYVYSGGQQLPSTTTRSSVLSSGNTTVEKRWYDNNGRVEKVTRTGYTLDDNEAVVLRVIATFYSLSRTCGGSAGPDALGRTLEVHGPCFVTSDTATSCSGEHAVTNYEYYGPSVGNANANRLHKVNRWAKGSENCTTLPALTTTYSDYDALGNAHTVTDENDVPTTYTFDSSSRVVSRTIDGHTTRFAYDVDKLTRVMQPEGNGEVFCYRTGGNDDCTTGNYTPQLQWKAKKACAGTTSFTCTGTWTERADYIYAADGTVSREAFRVCEPGDTCNSGSDGTLRRVLHYSNDAHRRNTWRKVGDSSGAFTSVSFFDRADNVAGVGHALNDAPAFCGGPNTGGSLPDEPVSKLCASLKYDRAERLVSFSEFPTTASSGETTCFGHDAHGNIVTVHSGCVGTNGCSIDGGSDGVCGAQGPGKASQYVFDDFGSIVFADHPWTSDGSGGKGRWRYVYNESGQVIRRRNPEQVAQGSGWYATFSYDKLGRPLQGLLFADSAPTEIWSHVYDGQAAVTGCPSFTNLKGRIARSNGALGRTYFSYDARGHVVAEVRTTWWPFPTSNDCTNSLEHSPHTFYTYTDNGNLKTVTYPYGRSVEYVYGSGAAKDRVSAIHVDRRTGGAWAQQTNVIHGVMWEPYGGLRRYRLGDAQQSTVEYRHGDDGETAPMSNFCTASWTPSQDDHTARLRALWVTAGNANLGQGAGDIYRRWYQWRGDVPVRVDSCLLNESTPRTKALSYDNKLQLLMADGGYPNGAQGRIGLAYDARGNRTLMTELGASTLTTSYMLQSAGDLLSTVSRSDTDGFTRSYGYDKNGRASSIAFGPNDGGVDSYQLGYYFGDRDTLSSMNIGGATYNFAHDYLRRRVAKQYPSGELDFYFYDLSNRILTDKGLDDPASPTRFPIDDYVWLDGRMVVIARGALTTSWTWLNDDTASTTDCAKAGEGNQACGFYFPITDHLGTPVLMLDTGTRVRGVSEADAFGYPNRGALSASTGAQPYAASQNSVLASFQVTNGVAGLSNQVRVKYAVFETEATNDYARLEEQSGSTGSSKSGFTGGPAWSDWLTLSSSGSTKTVDVRFVSNGSVQAPGVVVEAFEHRRFASDAGTYFFTPVRFAGQYHDVESDLFENWNRYYDPFTGRYLQPEPLASIVPQAGRLPTYSYARNNPALWSDPTGLFVFNGYDECPNYRDALDKARRLVGCANTCSECSQLIKACGYGDLCETLEAGRGPRLAVKDLPIDGLGRDGELLYLAGQTGYRNYQKWFGLYPDVEIARFDCGDPARVSELADTLIHEAIHVSDYMTGDKAAEAYSHDLGMECSAKSIALKCVP